MGCARRSLGKGGSALPAAAAQYLPAASRLLRDLSRWGGGSAVSRRPRATALPLLLQLFAKLAQSLTLSHSIAAASGLFCPAVLSLWCRKRHTSARLTLVPAQAPKPTRIGKA